MHIRWTAALGTDVVEEHSGDLLGHLHGILIHPDTGKIEGFFIRIREFLRADYPFLGTIDILSWGMRIEVRDRDRLSPVEERVRLQQLLSERREFLGASILTESGKLLGRCRDVQFDAKSFLLEWMFPKKFLQWGLPIPLSQVVEVRHEAIVVRESATPKGGKLTEPLLKTFPDAV